MIFLLLLAVGFAWASTAWAAGEASVPVSVSIPDKGLLSLGVYDGRNTLVRSLAAAKPVEKGTLPLTWDATTDLGLPVAPGKYHVRGVWFPHGPRAEYIMKVGVSGNPPYTPANGRGGWGGNLGGPETVCTNGKELTAVFNCVEDSLTTGVQRMDFEGKILGRYNTFFPWDVRLAGAMDDKHLYLAVAALGDHRLVIGKYDIGVSKGQILLDIPAGDHVQESGRWKGRWTTEVRGLAVRGDRLYVPMKLDDKLFVVDAEKGTIIATWPTASPRGVAARGGDLFVLSGKQLLRLDDNGRTAATLVDGLEDPSGLALDEAGNFYISDGGTAQQVKVFSPVGQRLRTIGLEGGRPRKGRDDARGMLDPRGLCVTPSGNLWVASPAEDFQRISVWNCRSGLLKREFFNTRLCHDQGRLTPDHAQMLFVGDVYADAPGMTAYDIDLEKRTWYPAWHHDLPIERMTQPDVFRGFRSDSIPPVFEKQAPYLSFAGGMIRGKNGKAYLFGGDFSIWLFDEKTTTPKLAALVYTHRAHRRPDGGYEGDYDQGPNNWFAWSDLNGDEKMSAKEIHFTENLPAMEHVPRLFGWELEPDLSILMQGPVKQGRGQATEMGRDAAGTAQDQTQRRADLRLVGRETPFHVASPQFRRRRRRLERGRADLSAGNPLARPACGTSSANRFSSRGSICICRGIDGDGWWASRNWRNSPMRFDSDGKPAWLKLGRRAPAKAAPGEMYYPRNIAADIDGVCFVDDTYAQTWVWTDTGLYLGRLYHEAYEQIHDNRGVFIESTGCWAYKIDGKIYSCIGDHGVFVHRVDLPTLTPIDGGAIEVSGRNRGRGRAVGSGWPRARQAAGLSRAIDLRLRRRRAGREGRRTHADDPGRWPTRRSRVERDRTPGDQDGWRDGGDGQSGLRRRQNLPGLRRGGHRRAAERRDRTAPFAIH